MVIQYKKKWLAEMLISPTTTTPISELVFRKRWMQYMFVHLQRKLNRLLLGYSTEKNSHIKCY